MIFPDELKVFLEAFVHTGIYIIDKQTMEVYYENATAQKYTVKNRIGKPCYLVHGNKSMCQSCPLRREDKTTYVIRKDYDMIFVVTATPVTIAGVDTYAITVRKQKDMPKNGGIAAEQLERMNRALNSSVLSYCEVNMVNMQCIAMHFSHSVRDAMVKIPYAEQLDKICERFVHPDDSARVKAELNPKRLKELSEDSEGPMEISVRYRSSQVVDRYIIYESRAYILRDELPHYVSVVTTEVTREEASKMLLSLYHEVSQNALAVFQMNLTKNWCGNGSGSNFVNPTEVEKLKKCDTVDALCAVALGNIIEGTHKEKARAFFSREHMLAEFSSGKNVIQCVFPYGLEHGSFKWVMVVLNMMKNPLTGDVEGILHSENVDDDVVQKHLISQLIKNDYDYLVLIDLKNNTAKAFTNEKMYAPMVTGNAREYIVDYIKRSYVGEDIVGFERKNSLEYVEEMLKIQEKYDIYYYNREKDGTIRYKKGTYSYPKGDKRYLLFSRVDNTDIVEKQQAINKKIREAMAAKEKAYCDRADFFARMSHDMRTPMNGILGMASLASEGDSAASLLHDMERIKRSGEYMLSLINDSLDLQRIESGKMQLNEQIVKLSEFVKGVVDMIAPAAIEKGVAFSAIYPNTDLDHYIKIDPIRLKQIYINLLNNAVKFTPSGGTVSWEFELISRVGDREEYLVHIRDTGVGMSEDFIKNQLFKPFTQEQNAMYSQYAGSGLGLAIVKNLVDLMGGTITVESKLDGGTTFTLHVFVDAVEKAQAETLLKQTEKGKYNTVHKLNGHKILLCEDHPLNAEIVKRLLQKAQCQVVWAENGQVGLDLFQKSEAGEFAAILMDIRMPVMDGLTASRAIRALPRADAKSIPIVAMTANAFEEDVQKSREAHMNAHLAKPIDPQMFYHTLYELLIGQGEDICRP